MQTMCRVSPSNGNYLVTIQVAKNSMTGRAYIGKVLIQVWLKSIDNKLVNVQQLSGFMQAPTSL